MILPASCVVSNDTYVVLQVEDKEILVLTTEESLDRVNVNTP